MVPEPADDKAAIVAEACRHVAEDSLAQASSLLRTEYPFVAEERAGRRYTKLQMTRVFVRDGFLDRYRGDRLIFPPVLRLLSHLLPEEFPYHPHGKMTRCHIAHWTLYPSIDHLVPLARGGKDEDANWVTTSMLRNMAKGQATLAELGWELRPGGRIEDWDGLLGWFVEHVRDRPAVLSELPPLRIWHRAAATALAERGR